MPNRGLTDLLQVVCRRFGKDLVSVRVPVTQLNQWNSPLFPGYFSLSHTTYLIRASCTEIKIGRQTIPIHYD